MDLGGSKKKQQTNYFQYILQSEGTFNHSIYLAKKEKLISFNYQIHAYHFVRVRHYQLLNNIIFRVIYLRQRKAMHNLYGIGL